MTRFKSCWKAPEEAAKKEVKAPRKVIKTKIVGEYSNKGEQRTIKKTPAVQKVKKNLKFPKRTDYTFNLKKNRKIK